MVWGTYKMLKSILSPSECAACRFCCSFRRKSLWETPLFDRDMAVHLKLRHPGTRFREAGGDLVTFDLIYKYTTDNSEEEVACPFLSETGCKLDADEKPFDCSIWPFRASRKNDRIVVVLENTCPAVAKVPRYKIQELLKSGLGDKILEYAEKHPDAIKDFDETIMEEFSIQL